MTSTPDESGPARPPLRVIRGDATPEEIAAIIAVLATASGAGDGTGDSASARSRWAEPASRMRPALAHGRGAWRFSSLPH